MLVDPLFGIWFPKPQGGFYGIHDLRQNPRILSQRIADLRQRGINRGAVILDTYDFHEYVYSDPRTINWSKSSILRLTYRALHHFWGDRVDEFPRPAFTAEPSLMVLYAALGLEFLLGMGWLLARGWRLKRKVAVPAGGNFSYAVPQAPPTEDTEYQPETQNVGSPSE